MNAPLQSELITSATLADLDGLPPHVVGELIDGRLIVAPRPRLLHGVVQLRLGAALEEAFGVGRPDGGDRWVFAVEPELRLAAAEALVPDLAGWRLERSPDLQETVFPATAPDWVCEVLSASTRGHDRLVKLPRYGERGVRWAWLIDPAERSIEVYRRENDRWVLEGGVADAFEPASLPPFDALLLDLTRLLPPLVVAPDGTT